MDDQIRQYANALYEQSLHDSAQLLINERTNLLKEWSARGSGNLPLGGFQIQAVVKLYVEHIERCMDRRLESYREAYREAGQAPNTQGLSEILKEIEEIQGTQERHAVAAIREFIKSRGPGSFDPTNTIGTATAHGHDRILRKWKVWRNQVELKDAAHMHRNDASQEEPAPDDWKFAKMALEEAKKSVAEDDRIHPKVGVVVVKNGSVLSKAHRGESLKGHAEFTALEKKLSDEAVSGATVFTTLEPCTTRNHPKIPCVERIIDRRVARVVIGMLDPNPKITGRGQRRLRDARIVVDSFPPEVADEVEELNREFTRQYRVSDSSDRQAPVANEEVNHEVQAYGVDGSEIDQGKRVVEEVIKILCAEKGVSPPSQMSWSFDFDRRMYLIALVLDGHEKYWELSEDTIKDCVNDNEVRRDIERVLAMYVI